MNFMLNEDHKGIVVSEGILWFKKWMVYLFVGDRSIILKEYDSALSLDEVKEVLKKEYPEIVFVWVYVKRLCSVSFFIFDMIFKKFVKLIFKYKI